jgi:alpha-methylacyl-CoA racemase
MPGPLAGYRIIEIAGIGPGPFCAMMLSDMGAEVIRVDRAQSVRGAAPAASNANNVSDRGRRNIALDLKHPDGQAALLALVDKADAIIEGFRPGVMERLGVGPDVCLDRNPKLVFGRMTGWGQDGPYGPWAGHDINYISLAGALAHFGNAGQKPVPPLNLVGDFGGGGMFLAFGVVCALLEAQKSGKGQVVDTSMVDGTAMLMAFFWGMQAMGAYDETARGTNLLDTGAHFYDTYQCSDGQYISLGSIEPQFYAELMRITGLADDPQFAKQMDKTQWPALKVRLADVFLQKSRAEWCALMEHTDVCFAPVLTLSEAAVHPHNVARGTFIEVDGVTQPAPAPRFSRTTPEVSRAAAFPGQHTREILTDWGFKPAQIDHLVSEKAAVQS